MHPADRAPEAVGVGCHYPHLTLPDQRRECLPRPIAIGLTVLGRVDLGQGFGKGHENGMSKESGKLP